MFVIHKSPADPTGTLEDHLAPLVSATWPEHYASARAFIDDGNKRDGHAESRKDAARLKAIITATAQFQHPGAPLSTVVARNGIPSTQFERCELSQHLVRFLRTVPW